MNNISSIHSRILDPVFDRKNNRVQFNFMPDTLYQSDLRLINIGITSDNADDSPNPILGLLGAIKRVALLDGSTLLDQLVNADLYNSFLNSQKSNDTNSSSTRHLNFNRIGYTTSGVYTVASDQIELNQPKINEQSPNTYSASSMSAKRCWISLKEMLPFLRNSIVLPTNVYKQLRLVIEYNSPAEMKYLTQATDANKETSENALLLVEEIGDGDFKEQAMKNYKGVVFRPIEHEAVSAKAVTPTGATEQQQNNYLVNGFNNKKLIKMVIIQSPETGAIMESGNNTIGYATMASLAQFQSQLQVRVNGSNLLAGQGQSQSTTGSGANRKLAYLNDAWGVSNIVLGQNVPNLNDYSNIVQHVDRVGQQHYLGLLVDANIQELQINYNRTCVANNAGTGNDLTNQALTLNIFGEVEKAVVMNKDGSYNVIYTQ